MPLLASRRAESSGPAPERRRGLTIRLPAEISTDFNHFSQHYWPLLWAALMLLGFVSGGWLGNTAPDLLGGRTVSIPGWVWRLPALLPLLLSFVRNPDRQLYTWILITLVAAAFGYQESRCRTAIPYAEVTTDLSPSSVCRTMVGTTIRVTAWPRSGHTSWSAPAIITGLGTVPEILPGLAPRIGDSVMIRCRGEAPSLWQECHGMLELGPAKPASIQGGFDQARYFAGRGIRWQGRFTQTPSSGSTFNDGSRELNRTDPLAIISRDFLTPLRAGLLARITTLLPPLAASMMSSVLLGEKDDRSRLVRQPFAVLGLAHLFAVSGLHVGILLAILLSALNILSPSPAVRLAVVSPVLLIYLVLTGMSPSVCRAVGLAIMVLSAPLAGRRYDSLYGLGLLFWLNYLWSPWSLLDTGLRLSYLAAVGIVAVCRMTSDLVKLAPRRTHAVLTGLIVTLAAQWFTLPEIIASFGWVNLAGPLANLVAVPVFGLAVWSTVLALVCDLVWSWLGGAVAACGWILLRLLVSGAFLSADTAQDLCWAGPPFGPWRLVCFLLVSIVLLWQLVRGARTGNRSYFQRSYRNGLLAICSLGLILVMIIPAGRLSGRGAMTAVQFDVGQGDCILLEFPDRWRIMIDTGPGWDGGSDLSWSVLPWLCREGITSLDAVLLTHGHADHTGGTSDLAAAVDIHTWYMGGSAAPAHIRSVPGSIGRWLTNGSVIHRDGRWSLVCRYQPVPETHESAENDCSTVVGLYHDSNLLAVWGGDLEVEGEECLLAEDQNPPTGRVQFWKAGHHGSRTSGSQPYLDRLHPQLITISCGVANRHDHPSHTPYIVNSDTLPTVRSDLSGTMFFRWDTDGTLHWHTHRRERGTIPGPVAPPL